jgi:hypothetical protein
LHSKPVVFLVVVSFYPFSFSALAQQASCIFDGDFVIVFMFFFCALLFFVLFTVQP